MRLNGHVDKPSTLRFALFFYVRCFPITPAISIFSSDATDRPLPEFFSVQTCSKVAIFFNIVFWMDFLQGDSQLNVNLNFVQRTFSFNIFLINETLSSVVNGGSSYVTFYLIKNFIDWESLREKCPYSEISLSVFFRTRAEYGEIRSISPYSV